MKYQFPFLDTRYETIPTSWEFAKQLIVLVLLDDFFFYLAHRAFHIKHKWLPLYQWFHKQHHEFAQPISICAMYATPIEFNIADQWPFLSGLYFLGPKCHFTTMLTWLFLRTWETTDGHSGYDFPWVMFRTLPFGGDARYHNFHHSKNVGNYCSLLTIWDTVFDTNTDYYLELEKKGLVGDNAENKKD